MNNEFRLSEEIVALSVSNSWFHAKREWFLESIYSEDDPQTCLCGHFPINEICIIRNKINGNSAVVGNICVKKFLGLPSDKIFQAIRRVRKDGTKSFNLETIEHAFGKSWVNEWERNFYLDTMRKRNLSLRQSEVRKEINEKLLKNMVKAKASDASA